LRPIGGAGTANALSKLWLETTKAIYRALPLMGRGNLDERAAKVRKGKSTSTSRAGRSQLVSMKKTAYGPSFLVRKIFHIHFTPI
jgi:hypothetical protein